MGKAGSDGPAASMRAAIEPREEPKGASEKPDMSSKKEASVAVAGKEESSVELFAKPYPDGELGARTSCLNVTKNQTSIDTKHNTNKKPFRTVLKKDSSPHGDGGRSGDTGAISANKRPPPPSIDPSIELSRSSRRGLEGALRPRPRAS